MKFKKLAGFGVVILFSVGMINQATSYTSAQITSQASMRIVSESEKALIEVKVDEDNFEINDSEILIPFTIINNMNRGIQRICLIEFDNDNIQIENIEDNQSIPAGASIEGLKFKYTGNNPSYIKIRFSWDGGSAIIKHLFALDASQINELLEKEEEDLGGQLLDTEESIMEEDIVNTIVPMQEDKDEDEQKSKEEEILKEEEKNKEEDIIDYIEEESSKSME